MYEMAVNSKLYGANYRSSPKFGANIVGYLNQGHPVDVIGELEGGRWYPCRIVGESGTYYISKNVLRKRISQAKEILAREGVEQWIRFKKGRGKESQSPYYKYVGEYWKRIGYNYDGKDTKVPWSAAFISFCVREAGHYADFNFSAAHSKYVHQAIRRKLDNINGSFWGYKIGQHKPQVGDMVCRRRAGQNIDYDYASNHSSFKSHCDIVIAVRDDHVSTIGGNVSNSVNRTNYPLNSSGYLSDTGRVYAVLRNNL